MTYHVISVWHFPPTNNVLLSFATVEASILAKSHIYLTAEGLDTIGQVTVNGHALGAVDNMFIRYRFPVKEVLKEKGNIIQVHFESAPQTAKNIQEKKRNEKYVIPPCEFDYLLSRSE